jgi:hypothetical protein
MIWHIFRKDLRLLWPLATLIACVQWLNAGLLIAGGRFARSTSGEMTEFGWVSNIALPGVALLGLVVLVMAVIQQDRLPGTTQDWLTRPIPRGRLFAAKLLFILLIGLLPILAADLAMGLAEQLQLSDVVAGSLTRSAVLLCLVCLPAALIGAVTRTLTEALVLVVAVGVLLIVEFITLVTIRAPLSILQSGFSWIIAPVLMLLNLCALLVLIPLQIRWRSTNRVRWILAGYFCLLPAVNFIPVGAAFQIDRAFESRSVDSSMSITLDKDRKITFTPTPAYTRGGRKPLSVMLRIPVVLSNLGPRNHIYVDRIELHLIDLKTRGLEGASSNEDLSSVNHLADISDRSSDPSKPTPELFLTLPFDAFNSARAAQSRIEARLLTTTLRLTAEKSIRSLAAGSIDDHGRCYLHDTTRFGSSSKVLYCVSTRPIGNCVDVKDLSHPVRNIGTTSFRCGGSTYAPRPLPLWRDAYYSVVLWQASEGLQQMRAEPSSARPPSSDITIANYVPDIHVVRTLDFEVASAVERTSVESRSADGVGHAARFASLAAVVADRRGNLFMVDEADSVIRKMTPSGEVDTFAGMAHRTGRDDGVGRDARFSSPHGIAIDGVDNLFVADTGNGIIRKITPAGTVSTVMGVAGASGSGTQPLRFNNPRGVICTPDGTLYILASNAVVNGDSIVRKVSPAGVVSTAAGSDEPVGTDNRGVVLAIPPEEMLERD